MKVEGVPEHHSECLGEMAEEEGEGEVQIQMMAWLK